jgi:hypothetical protein
MILDREHGKSEATVPKTPAAGHGPLGPLLRKQARSPLRRVNPGGSICLKGEVPIKHTDEKTRKLSRT